jgi:L-ascorbate metabolism protein UlaG (beta-lactamase superfamily)
MNMRWRRIGIVLATIALLLAATTGWVLQQPPFGGQLEGARLARAKANPQYRDGRFVNVQPEAPTPWTTWIEYPLRQWTDDAVREPPRPLPVLAVDKAALAAAPPASGLRAFWIGHASSYVEIDGLRVLLDPVFAERVSPLPVGPKRFHAPPVALADLPAIDAVLISHDHYDHLDMDATRRLAAGGRTRFIVPLGIGAHLERWGVAAAQIVELEWWQEHAISGVRFVCTPTRHYSGRALQRSPTLWSSWSVVGPAHRFYYSGDTGYSQHFAEVGQRLGPFDIGFVKIGAYGPGQSWIDIHMTPEDAVRAAQDVSAKRLFPVHWSTFNLAYHAWDEPIRRTVAEARRRGMPLVTPRLGEWVDADRPFSSMAWWEAVR